MFRVIRSDTFVRTLERRYKIDLNVRDDTKLGNLLDQRGFDSFSQLLQAYRRRLTYHPRRRRVFLSFHGEDLAQVRGFRLMAHAPNVEVDFFDRNLEPINSAHIPYVKQGILEKIRRAEVVICLIGNGTAWREMVDWELNRAVELGKGVCGVRLKRSHGRTPPLLMQIRAPVASWGDTQAIIAVIECAAARRS
jgi:MTH538 TIR-like domain (DUF1863)